MQQASRQPNLFSLSIFWFAWEVHWSALLGAGLQGQIARFTAPQMIGTASAILAGGGAAFSILSQYVAGKASDRAGRRMPFIVAGTLLDIGALFAFALAPTFLTVLIAYVGVQVSLNIAGGPYQALIPDRVAMSSRGRASAVMGLFRLSGNVAGLLLAKVFVHQPGPSVSNTIFTKGLLELAGAVAALLMVALVLTLIGVSDTPAARLERTASAEWPSRASFIWLIVSRSFVSMGLYAILPFFAFYLRFAQHVGTYIAKSLDLLIVMTVCSIAGTIPAGIAGDRIAKKRILFVALFLLALGAVCLGALYNLRLLIWFAIVLGVGWGAYYSVDWALATNLLPPGRAGALMAIWNIGASGPQVAAPVVGGLLVDRVGAATADLGAAYRLLFVAIAAFVILGGVALAFVREPRAGLATQTE